LTEDEAHLTRVEARERASSGVFFTASAQLVLLGLGFFGNLALARLLTPRDFGIIAIGTTVMVLVTAVTEGGLVSGMLRRETAPSRAELRTLAGLQLLLATGVFAVAAPIALQFGQPGEITAVMLLALPLSAPQAAGRVFLLRQMVFSRLALAELGAAIAYYAWAIPAVVAGLGVWGMATATVAKAAALSLLFASLAPEGRLAPSLRGARAFGPVISFGAKFQATWIAFVSRDQALNMLTASIGGLTTLGYWSLALKLLQLPVALIDSIHRVTYPAMVHLLGEHVDPRPRIERTVRGAGIVTSLFLTTFAAGAPGLVPAAFGAQWEAAVWAVLPASLAIAIVAPVAAGAVGYVQAVNRPGVLFRGVTLGGVAWLATTAALLPVVGVASLGIGWVAAAVCEAIVYSSGLRDGCGTRFLVPALAPAATCLPAAAVGCAIAFSGGSTALSGVLGSVCAAALAVGSLWLVRRDDLRATARLVVRAVRDALRPFRARRSVRAI
jgi:O-antigen/teichoic acid export membrane protein